MMADTTAAVAAAMREAGAEALLVGGFAVNHYGYSRNTLDLDFMVAADRMEPVGRALVRAGFSNVERLENVAFFERPGLPLRVDVLAVDAATMRELTARAVDVECGSDVFKVPALEDLIAMKLFALKHNWARRVHKDLPDLAQLVVLNRVDRPGVLRPLCRRFADEAVYEAIEREAAMLEGA